MFGDKFSLIQPIECQIRGVELGPMGPKPATKFGPIGPNLGGSKFGMTVLFFLIKHTCKDGGKGKRR